MSIHRKALYVKSPGVPETVGRSTVTHNAFVQSLIPEIARVLVRWCLLLTLGAIRNVLQQPHEMRIARMKLSVLVAYCDDAAERTVANEALPQAYLEQGDYTQEFLVAGADIELGNCEGENIVSVAYLFRLYARLDASKFEGSGVKFESICKSLGGQVDWTKPPHRGICRPRTREDAGDVRWIKTQLDASLRTQGCGISIPNVDYCDLLSQSPIKREASDCRVFDGVSRTVCSDLYKWWYFGARPREMNVRAAAVGYVYDLGYTRQG